MKKESKVANSTKDRKDSLVKLLTLVLFSKSLSTQMLVVFSNGILVNRDSMSKLVIQCAQSTEDTSSANENESFIVKSFDVKGVNNEARNLASLYNGVFIAERMPRRERHRSVTGLCTLAIPYNIPGRELKLKQIFRNNEYPKNFADRCIKMYLDRVFVKHPNICIV